MVALAQDSFTLQTRGRGFYNIGQQLEDIVQNSGMQSGLCNVFIHHTSASLLITENADPQVHRDLEAYFARLVPDGDALFGHVDEGPDDMPSHIRAALTQTSLSIPLERGRCAFGTWQSPYVWEHRKAPHQRRLSVHVLGA